MNHYLSKTLQEPFLNAQGFPYLMSCKDDVWYVSDLTEYPNVTSSSIGKCATYTSAVKNGIWEEVKLLDEVVIVP